MNPLDEAQVYDVLEQIGVDVAYETDTDFVGFCPFHNNVHSPAFCVSKDAGVYYCHNGACDERGTFRQLIKRMTGWSEFRIEMILHKAQQEFNYKDYMVKKNEQVDMPSFPKSDIDALHSNLKKSTGALNYLLDRGFTMETIKYFKLGYSPTMHMVSVPMYDAKGNPLGVVGRSIHDKQFKNSPGLPKKIVPWNIHHAKKYASVIVTEASFDSMRVHQAGYPGTVALLGSKFSDHHAEAFDRYFKKIIFAGDDDTSGDAMAEQIMNKLPSKPFYWAMLGNLPRYDGAKDMCQLSDQLIKQAVDQAEHNMIYRRRFDKSS